MNKTILIGKKYRVFLKNKFKYEGIALAADETFIKINDDVKGRPILLPLDTIDNIEEVA